VARRFVEHDHPRWPAEAPDSKGGEFRDKTPDIGGGGDWADRLSGRIGVQPAGRHGSVATGLRQTCPVCYRQVKVVGSGKLSTHNGHDGKRCPGSGMPATVKPPADIQRAPTRRTPGAKPPPAKKATRRAAGGTLRPPPPPKVTPGAWDAPVTGAAETRMANWRSRTMHRQADGSMYHPNTAATRAAEIQRLHHDIQAEEKYRQGRRNTAMWAAARTALGLRHWEFLPPGAEKGYEDAGDSDPHVQVAEAKLRALRNQLDYAESAIKSDRPFDPTNPLAYYGSMLHIESNDWFAYGVLDQLEQRVPPAFHKAVAEWLAYQSRHNNSAGIWVGSTHSIRDLDNLKRQITKPPRGWGKKATMATWDDVDGVVSGSAVYAVVHTENSESHLRSRRGYRRVAGQPDELAVGDAGLHEFGHVLDAAMGFFNTNRAYRWDDASAQRKWRLIHGKVKRDSRTLSPYYRQKGDAGPEEFWADAFFTWASADPELDPIDRDVEYPRRRTITKQDRLLAETYGTSLALAQEISDYFNGLHRDLVSGRRLPRIEQRRP